MQVESVKQLIAHFDRLIDELDKQIDDHTHTYFYGKAQVAGQIKGIGSITTATLMAMLPELGRLSHKRIVSLVGIAPHPRESGETKFKSRCFGGRSAVRKALYMAAVVATRFEPLIRDFYQRLLHLLKIAFGVSVIVLLIQGDAFVQQGFCLFVLMRNGGACGEKGGDGKCR